MFITIMHRRSMSIFEPVAAAVLIRAAALATHAAGRVPVVVIVESSGIDSSCNIGGSTSSSICISIHRSSSNNNNMHHQQHRESVICCAASLIFLTSFSRPSNPCFQSDTAVCELLLGDRSHRSTHVEHMRGGGGGG